MDIHLLFGPDLPDAEVVRLADTGTFFQTKFWLRICAEGLPADPVVIAAFDDGMLRAILPGIITRRLGRRSFYSMPFGTYGGMVVSERLEPVEQNEFLGYLAGFIRGGKFSRVSIVDFGQTLSDQLGGGLTRTDVYTHILDIDEAAPDLGIDKKVRYEIAAGEKSGGEVVRLIDRRQVGEFYSLYQKAERRRGRRPLYPRRLFEVIAADLLGSDRLLWNALVDGGRIIGSQIHFLHRDTMFYWQAVSAEEVRPLRPDYRLFYDALQHAVKQGIKTVNLGASPPDAEGVVFFKERWGARRCSYPIWHSESWWRRWLAR